MKHTIRGQIDVVRCGVDRGAHQISVQLSDIDQPITALQKQS
jgi:hypothetical protein